ncbi:MAG: SufD family Fe-S cluster assembly protein [Candidatus Roizmanbacteria bacterium]|nr:SufD family Fe-S cluster assembly protein [Candidatus Roizmanbacteria bacterium]
MSTQFITINGKNNKQVFTKPGKYVVFFSNISGTISCVIKSEKVEVYLVGLYDMKNSEAYKIHTEQIHSAPHSFSDLYVLAIANDSSSLAFSGLIRIEKDAQQSHAYQKNQNLILSNNAFVDSRPILEILANDVFCTHGSTSGPISKEQLSYLQMRGLTLPEATQISIEGFKQQVYDKLSSLGMANYDRR